MDLIERAAELAVLDEALRSARAGSGGVVMVEAPAGQGKTALLRALRVDAARAGMRVLTATAALLERDFPFGIARQLFEGELRDAGPARRERLLSGAARLAADIGVADESDDSVDRSQARLNGCSG